jgi:hypothetical protein
MNWHTSIHLKTYGYIFSSIILLLYHIFDRSRFYTCYLLYFISGSFFYKKIVQLEKQNTTFYFSPNLLSLEQFYSVSPNLSQDY